MNDCKPLTDQRIKSEIERHRRETWKWWKLRHGGNIALIALVSGVSRQTVRRWNRVGEVPTLVAALLDQIQHGPAVRLGTFRGLHWRTDAPAGWLGDGGASR